MSTLSKDLDYFDAGVYDPLAELPAHHPSEVSFEDQTEKNMTCDEDTDEIDRKEKFLSVPSEETEGEDEDYWQEGESTEKTLAGVSEKDEKLSSSVEAFTTSLWSDDEAFTPRSSDPWDFPMGVVPWDDNEKPIAQLLNYADLTLTEDEENGLLTDRIIAACSSYLTETPGNKCHVVAKVCLNNKNLNDIRLLGYHRFLQYIDLSWNNLVDLTPLGCIPYLMYLDVSHNLLEVVLRFQPPLNLTYVNYSFNKVWQIDDLSDFWALCYLDLSHNEISKIQGLHNLRYLRHLDLSHNKIERLENLNNLNITDLNLEYNLISRVETEMDLGLRTLPYLTNVYLNNNLLQNLEFLKDVFSLKKLELQGNNISDLVQLSEMKHMKNLRQLDLSGNPVSYLKPYRNVLISFLSNLKFLDQTEVLISERVAAGKKQRYDVQLEAARNHARMLLLEQLNDTTLDSDVLPVDQSSYPFVILVGPSSSSKKYLMTSLWEKYPDKIYVGKLHTTRTILNPEKTFLKQTDREEFSEMIKSGMFLCVSEHLGHLYGFSREELGNAIRESKLCLTALDLVSALTVHSYGIRPFLVLTIPHSKEEHTKRLKLSYGPILSKIGVAYMAQRQLINTHESNIKRIETILLELVDYVLEKTCRGSSKTLESNTNEDQLVSSLRGSSSDAKMIDTQNSDSETSDVFVCYDSSKCCYPCSPGLCGYQTSRNEREDSEASLQTIEESLNSKKKLKTTESETTSTTSYSAVDGIPTRIQSNVYDGSEFDFGESDTFASWSMPFVEWSEVNLSGLQLEEAAEVLCEKYIESVMSTRDVYVNVHLDNPGLFSLCVYTDDTVKAMKNLSEFLKEVWRTTPSRKPPFDLKDDVVYQAFVPRKLQQLREIMQTDFLSSGDNAIGEMGKIPSNNSPGQICREMHVKGYGDSLDDLKSSGK